MAHEENWDAYLGSFDGKVASFFIDFGLHAAPFTDKPWAVVIRFDLLDSREDGLTKGEEFEVLNAIDDAILAVWKGAPIVYAGRMTTDRKRVLVFYAAQEIDASKALAQVFQRFPEYRFETSCSEDCDWHFYKCTLYPHPEEMQCLQNRRVLDALEEDGDTLQQPREVTHWAYFERPADREAFSDAVHALGYKVDVHENEHWAPRIYCAVLNRVDRVYPDSINEVVLQLFRLAKHHDGEYD